MQWAWGNIKQGWGWAQVIDHDGNELLTLNQAHRTKKAFNKALKESSL